jgi:hypothetical protein
MDSFWARARMQGGDHAMFNGFGAHGGAGAVQPPFGQVRSCTDQVQDTKNLPFLSFFFQFAANELHEKLVYTIKFC